MNERLAELSRELSDEVHPEHLFSLQKRILAEMPGQGNSVVLLYGAAQLLGDIARVYDDAPVTPADMLALRPIYVHVGRALDRAASEAPAAWESLSAAIALWRRPRSEVKRTE